MLRWALAPELACHLEEEKNKWCHNVQVWENLLSLFRNDKGVAASGKARGENAGGWVLGALRIFKAAEALSLQLHLNHSFRYSHFWGDGGKGTIINKRIWEAFSLLALCPSSGFFQVPSPFLHAAPWPRARLLFPTWVTAGWAPGLASPQPCLPPALCPAASAASPALASDGECVPGFERARAPEAQGHQKRSSRGGSPGWHSG